MAMVETGLEDAAAAPLGRGCVHRNRKVKPPHEEDLVVSCYRHLDKLVLPEPTLARGAVLTWAGAWSFGG